jgi:hypothetical protein
MKTLIAVLAALLLSSSLSLAAEDKKPLTASQQRMVDCNKDATGKKGDARKAFMSECMKADKAPATQQNRMKECNVKAADKKGDIRKAFMSDCLKNK